LNKGETDTAPLYKLTSKPLEPNS